MEDVVIVDAARSPVGRKNGSLGGAHPTDVLGQVMTGLLARNDIDSSTVDQVVGGCINKLAAQGMNVTRTAWLASGGAIETPCITIDSQCGSSQQAIHFAAQAGVRYSIENPNSEILINTQRRLNRDLSD